MRQSLISDQSGASKVAGLFFSMKKWPNHAGPWPKNGRAISHYQFPVATATTCTSAEAIVPT